MQKLHEIEPDLIEWDKSKGKNSLDRAIGGSRTLYTKEYMFILA